ncbi:MAG: hypothetical protein OXC11_14055 [Rhodospirillales bacterium]|nr:hypothetical protein [Rhodospirillales bacterium]
MKSPLSLTRCAGSGQSTVDFGAESHSRGHWRTVVEVRDEIAMAVAAFICHRTPAE